MYFKKNEHKKTNLRDFVSPNFLCSNEYSTNGKSFSKSEKVFETSDDILILSLL